MDMRDEGRVRRGAIGQVEFLGERIPVRVREVRVAPNDGKMYADCDDGSGECRWCLVEEVIAEK